MGNLVQRKASVLELVKEQQHSFTMMRKLIAGLLLCSLVVRNLFNYNLTFKKKNNLNFSKIFIKIFRYNMNLI